MKVLTGYLDRAMDLERLAADEGHSTFKIQLLTQAAAYRQLAAERSKKLGLPPPSYDPPPKR